MEYWSNGSSQHSITPVLHTPVCLLHHSVPPSPPRGLSQHQVQQPVHTFARNSAFVDDGAGLAFKIASLPVGEACRGNHNHGYPVHLRVGFE